VLTTLRASCVSSLTDPSSSAVNSYDLGRQEIKTNLATQLFHRIRCRRCFDVRAVTQPRRRRPLSSLSRSKLRLIGTTAHRLPFRIRNHHRLPRHPDAISSASDDAATSTSRSRPSSYSASNSRCLTARPIVYACAGKEHPVLCSRPWNVPACGGGHVRQMLSTRLRWAATSTGGSTAPANRVTGAGRKEARSQ
jgi:hypothetical protein